MDVDIAPATRPQLIATVNHRLLSCKELSTALAESSTLKGDLQRTTVVKDINIMQLRRRLYKNCT